MTGREINSYIGKSGIGSYNPCFCELCKTSFELALSTLDAEPQRLIFAGIPFRSEFAYIYSAIGQTLSS